MQSIYPNTEFRTRFLNTIRSLLMNTFGEKVLRYLTTGKNVNSFFSKITPNYYQYSPDSFRRATSPDGIRFELNISDIIDWYIYYGFKEKSKEKLISAALDSKTVIDVGANVGEISLRIAKYTASQIYSFEPDPTNYSRLIRNLELNTFKNITPIKKGLGSEQGSALLHTETIHNRGRNKIISVPLENSVEIEMTTIDNFKEEHSLLNIDFIKIDVEGYEQNVILGAKKTLSKDKPKLFIEIDDNNLRTQGSSAKNLIKVLTEFGYSLTKAETDEVVSINDNFRNCHFDILALPN